MVGARFEYLASGYCIRSYSKINDSVANGYFDYPGIYRVASYDVE